MCLECGEWVEVGSGDRGKEQTEGLGRPEAPQIGGYCSSLVERRGWFGHSGTELG